MQNKRNILRDRRDTKAFSEADHRDLPPSKRDCADNRLRLIALLEIYPFSNLFSNLNKFIQIDAEPNRSDSKEKPA